MTRSSWLAMKSRVIASAMEKEWDRWPVVSITRLVEQLAADQHAADLGGAGADLVELGVAQQAAGRKFVDIAVAAEDLHGVEGSRGGFLRGIEDRAGGVLARCLAAVAGAGDSVNIGFAGVHGRVHVGELALDQLELADRLAELLAVVDVGDHDVEAGLHDA